MTIAITGAGGQLGRRTAEFLLERVDPAAVVLVTRRPAALADLAARGAAVRAGDFDDPRSLAAAFAGARRLLLISTDAVGRRIEQHGAAIQAAVDADVHHVAYTSLPNPVPENPAAVAAEHRATEELLELSGLDWTFLRNAIYSEFRVPEARAAIASGRFHHNLGRGRTAYVSREDCAAVAAAVMADGAAHERRAYDVTGPELLGGTELTELYAQLGGRPVEQIELGDEELAAQLVAAGLPEPAAELVVSFGAAVRLGFLDQLSPTVQNLTGRAPRSVREVLEPALAAA